MHAFVFKILPISNNLLSTFYANAKIVLLILFSCLSIKSKDKEILKVRIDKSLEYLGQSFKMSFSLKMFLLGPHDF